MDYDLHIHSKYSYDSFQKIETIIKVAKKRGLNGIAITDHNTLKGGLEAFKINKDPDFEVIVGSEIKTEYGDILGIYLNEEIKTMSFEEVVDEIKSQDGLVILPHPYRQYETPENIIRKVDVVEGFNARVTKSFNEKSSLLAEKYDKGKSAGSDAHLNYEIGKGRVIVENDLRNSLLNRKTKVVGNESNYYIAHGLSVSSEKLKCILNKLRSI